MRNLDHKLIRVFDILGHQVKSFRGTELDISDQPDGVYFLQTTSETLKVVKE